MYLSVQQAARRLGVSPVTIRRWTATGLPAVHAHGRRPPAHRRARHRRPRQGHRRQQPPGRPARARARGRRAHQHGDGAGGQARPHRAAARDRHAHDQPARLPLLRHLRVRRPRTTRCARWPSTTTPASACPTRARTACATSRSLGACSASRSRSWSTSTTPTPTPRRSPSCAGRATAACSWSRWSSRDAAWACSRSSTRSARAQYSRQELRLAEAIAGQAAVAIQNAKLFAERRRSDEDVASLREALASLTADVPRLGEGERRSDALDAVAEAVCEALGAISCVASLGGESAGAFGAGRVAAAPGRRRARRPRQPRRRARPVGPHRPHARRHAAARAR